MLIRIRSQAKRCAETKNIYMVERIFEHSQAKKMQKWTPPGMIFFKSASRLKNRYFAEHVRNWERNEIRWSGEI